MKQSKAIITTLLLFLASGAALPVTSKALENNSDQLIWQTAWYSDARASPFTGDSKKISPKSIFITPNLDQNPASCPPGFKIDDNGKCIKVISINQDDLLVTRLQSFFSQHQTTDDSTSIDYDYSVDEGDEATHYDLPLIPIFNDTRGDKEPDESFLGHNSSQDSDTVAIDAATILPANDLINATKKTIADENSNDTRVNESDINSDQNDTTTVDESGADTTAAFANQFEDESNYTTTTPNEFVIKDSEKPLAETTISSESHLGDYFDVMLQNDSLIIDDSYSYENSTDADADFEVTTVEFDVGQGSEKSPELLNDDKALQDMLEKMKVSNEAPTRVEELSSSDRTSAEVASTERASIEVYSTDEAQVELSSSEKASLEVLGLEAAYSKASLELSNSRKASQELLNSQKASQELLNLQKASQELLSSQKASQELLSSQKVSQELLSSQNASQVIKSSQKASQELLNSQKVPGELSSAEKVSYDFFSTEKPFQELYGVEETSKEFYESQKLPNPEAAQKFFDLDRELLNVHKPSIELTPPEKASLELSSSQKTSSESHLKLPEIVLTTTEASFPYSTKASVELLNKVPAHLLNKAQEDSPIYTKIVTVEKTSSKPSIVNGPFLIFGQPFERPSSAETTAKVVPEISSQGLNPASAEHFEYSTFDTVDGNFSPSAVDSSIPVGFSFTENQNKTETQTTNSPPTTQNFEFTPSFPYENRIIKDDQQNRALESAEEANKFVYHHLPAGDVSSTPPVVRFPSQQRVRFPDEPSRSSSISWPRDNGLMRFWQEQPLINDFKIFSRGHSNFRRPSYRRNQ